MLPTDELIGQTIRNYEFISYIGRGAFGAVYQALQKFENSEDIQRDVAIKVVLPRYSHNAEYIKRFGIEARFVARLQHPHIVPLFDYWCDDKGAYLVMRLLADNLHNKLRHGPLDPATTARILEQVALALNLAHRNNIIHRDIKPANILLDDDGNAYLSDFGIAKDLSLETSGSDHSGTPAYKSPEQFRGEKLTPQSDIYSLGLVLFEMLTGSVPFTNITTYSEMEAHHLYNSLPSVTDFHPELSKDYDEVIQRATAKPPSARYANVLELATSFKDLVYAAPQAFTFFETNLDEVERPVPPTELSVFLLPDKMAHFSLRGRNDLFNQLKQTLTSETDIAIYGAPGIGKSALAHALVYDPAVRAAFADGILWSTLGHAETDVSHILTEWGQIFGISVQEDQHQNDFLKRQLQAVVGGKRLLIVLDDVWSEEQAELLHFDGPTYIYTSRLFDLAAQLCRENTELSGLDPDSAWLLLTELAPTLKPEYKPEIRQLIDKVGGIPQALMLLGPKLRRAVNLSRLKHIIAHIDADLGPLFASIRYSMSQLTDQHIDLLRLAALLRPEPNTFDDAFLASYRADYETILYDLIDASLMRVIQERYALPPIIADFAAREDGGTNLTEHIISYYGGFAHDHTGNFATLELERQNIEVAIQLAPQNIKAILAFYPLWEARGELDKAEQYLAEFLKDDKLGAADLSQVLLALSRIEKDRGHFQQSESYVRQAMQATEQVEDAKQRVSLAIHLLTHYGAVKQRQGLYKEAHQQFSVALGYAEQLKNAERTSALLMNLALMDKKLDNIALAKQQYLRALQVARNSNDKERVCHILQNLAVLESEQRQFTNAEEHLTEALEIAQQLKHHNHHAGVLLALANLEFDRGEWSQAEQYFKQALQKAAETGNVERLSYGWLGLADNYLSMQRLADAEASLKQALIYTNKGEDRPVLEILVAIMIDVGNLRLEHDNLEHDLLLWQDVSELAHLTELQAKFQDIYRQLA